MTLVMTTKAIKILISKSARMMKKMKLMTKEKMTMTVKKLKNNKMMKPKSI